MTNFVIPADDIVTVSTGSGSSLIKKHARDLSPTDYVWAFIAEHYFPTVSGHFEFVKLSTEVMVKSLKSYDCTWFNSKDGPHTFIPKDWKFFTDYKFENIGSKKSFLPLAHPGHLHDEIPSGLGFNLFSEHAMTSQLTEELAYFLGAFAFRPQCYELGTDTWGIFGTRVNQAGVFGAGSSSLVPDATHAKWQKTHLDSMRTLAETVWGKGNFQIEQKGAKVGLNNTWLPKIHPEDRFLKSAGIGFSIHAPIAAGIKLNSEGRFDDEDLRVLQFWYACLESYLLERSSVSVRKAFLLGAMDTGSNADSDRKSIGLDWPENFSGEFPFYSTVHAVGREVLASFEGEETQNPRYTKGRLRGRIPRCKIWDQMQQIGFISPLKAERAFNYEPDISVASVNRFPTPNALSVIFGFDVTTVNDGRGYGADESDLTQHKLFRGQECEAEFVVCSGFLENAYPACSLPLGSISMPEIVSSKPKLKKIQMDARKPHDDALDHLKNIERYLFSSKTTLVSADMIFEYLIALLISDFESCKEACVIPRSEDQGVDAGARFNHGGAFGDLKVIVQAKLQAQPVSRRVIDMLRGSVSREGAAIGYVITNNRFTVHAVNSAKRDYPEIRIISGNDLIDLLIKHQIGFEESGRGLRKRVLLNVAFFQSLHDLAVKTKSSSGEIRIKLGKSRMPETLI